MSHITNGRNGATSAWLRETIEIEEEEALALQAEIAAARQRATNRYAGRTVDSVLSEFRALGFDGFEVRMVDGADGVKTPRFVGVSEAVPEFLQAAIASGE